MPCRSRACCCNSAHCARLIKDPLINKRLLTLNCWLFTIVTLLPLVQTDTRLFGKVLGGEKLNDLLLNLVPLHRVCMPSLEPFLLSCTQDISWHLWCLPIVSTILLHLRYLTSAAWKSLPFTLQAFNNLWIVIQKRIATTCAFDHSNLFVSENLSSPVKFKGRLNLFRAVCEYLWSIEELMFLPCSWVSSAPGIFLLGGTTLITKGNCALT